jgi:hypothetical protein
MNLQSKLCNSYVMTVFTCLQCDNFEDSAQHERTAYLVLLFSAYLSLKETNFIENSP